MSVELEPMRSPREVADLFGVSYYAVLRAIHRGELHAERVFNRIRIPDSAIRAYREASRVQPAPRRLRAVPAPAPAPAETGSLAALRAIEREAG